MEFHEKLQELRKQRGLTQEQLATALYVSRAAISKWESGRGYPNIDSLRAIARFFSLTVDELLSGEELLFVAEADGKQKQGRTRDLVYGLLDVSAALLLFLPFFATRGEGTVQSASLLMLAGARFYLKLAYLVAVIATVTVGILTLAMQGCELAFWHRGKVTLSLTLGTSLVLLFILSSQPYAAVFVFALLVIKALMLLKCT